MPLSPKTSVPNIEFENQLVQTRAEYLRNNLYVANIGSSAVFLVLAYFFWGSDLAQELYYWLGIGLSSSLFRSVLMYVYRKKNCFEKRPELARQYLYLYTIGTFLAGSAFAYGWLALIPHLSLYEQLIYLLSIIALLFGGLFAYSPYFPAYIAFSSSALWLSPLLLDYTSEIYMTGLAFGIWLIALVSTMFAYRFSTTFKVNKELEVNVYRLLSEVTLKRDEAVSANLAKSRFLASVSHDLRQPMHAVSLSLSTLQQLIGRKQEVERLHPMVDENLAGLQHSVQYLNSMFEALLDISRLDAGTLNINIEYQEIQSLLKSLEYEYSIMAKQEGLSFSLNIPSNFHMYLVRVDIRVLERLLRNLITNAIRYTSKGGIRLSIRTKNNLVDIRVIDTGLGVPKAMKEKIFEEFIQLQSPSAREKNIGMGLGLSIARRLGSILGSSIRLYSHMGQGSVFALRLPAKIKHDAKSLQADKPEQHFEFDRIAGALIIVVDDDPKICEATKSMLELQGAEVVIADSGAAAIKALAYGTRIPNLILSDYRLIGETGLDCIENIRNEFNETISAVVITGDTAPEELTLLKNSGIEVVYKPIMAEALLRAISRNIQK